MTLKNKNITIKVLTLVGIIPSFYLLGISFIFLPAIFSDLFKNPTFEDFIMIILMLFGICGFLGLAIQLFTNLFTRIKLKIALQFLSIIGYFGFFTFINGMDSWMNAFESIKNIDENFFELYFVLAPIIITIVLITINLKIQKNKNYCQYR